MSNTVKEISNIERYAPAYMKMFQDVERIEEYWYEGERDDGVIIQGVTGHCSELPPMTGRVAITKLICLESDEVLYDLDEGITSFLSDRYPDLFKWSTESKKRLSEIRRNEFKQLYVPTCEYIHRFIGNVVRERLGNTTTDMSSEDRFTMYTSLHRDLYEYFILSLQCDKSLIEKMYPDFDDANEVSAS